MKEIYNKEKKLVKNTLLYTISSFGTKIFNFLIVPLYTYYLTTSEYGTYDTIYSIIYLIAPMCILAIHEGILRWLLNSEEEDRCIVGTGFSLYFIFIAITDIILIIIFQVYTFSYSWLLILCLTTTTLYEVMQFSIRGIKDNISFAISGVIQTVIMLGMNVFLIIFIKIGIIGMLASLASSQFISSIYLYLKLKKYFKNKKMCFSKKLAKELLIYSIMLVPNNISWWVMNSSDKLMLTAMIGSAYTGIYSIATKFPSLLNMLHTIFYRAWQEQAVIEYNDEERDQYYSKIFNIYMKITFCFVLILIPISKIYIKFFMDVSFSSAYIYIGILMLGTIFCSFSSFFGTGYISAKDTKNATITTTIGAIINCIVNLLFIKKIGIWAACCSTLIGYLITWLIRVYQTRKYFIITIKWKTFFILLIVSSIYSFIGTIDNNIITFLSLFLALIITLILNYNIIIKGIILIKDSFYKKIYKERGHKNV